VECCGALRGLADQLDRRHRHLAAGDLPVIAAIRDWGRRHLAQANGIEMVAAE
jgi:hypothetical protein